MLHQHEQIRRKARDHEMKTKMKYALDSQKVEKQRRKEIDKIENRE